jgi:hypothetical protein
MMKIRLFEKEIDKVAKLFHEEVACRNEKFINYLMEKTL